MVTSTNGFRYQVREIDYFHAEPSEHRPFSFQLGACFDDRRSLVGRDIEM